MGQDARQVWGNVSFGRAGTRLLELRISYGPGPIFSCGIDIPARKLSLCVIDTQGVVAEAS